MSSWQQPPAKPSLGVPVPSASLIRPRDGLAGATAFVIRPQLPLRAGPAPQAPSPPPRRPPPPPTHTHTRVYELCTPCLVSSPPATSFLAQLLVRGACMRPLLPNYWPWPPFLIHTLTNLEVTKRRTRPDCCNKWVRMRSVAASCCVCARGAPAPKGRVRWRAPLGAEGLPFSRSKPSAWPPGRP